MDTNLFQLFFSGFTKTLKNCIKKNLKLGKVRQAITVSNFKVNQAVLGPPFVGKVEGKITFYLLMSNTLRKRVFINDLNF
jgi:hypothetical protein